MALAAGALLGHYEIIAPLGAGGMGEVYLAEDTRLERKVALKLLPAEFTKDADRVRRFEQEAKAVSALNHPHIITIHEIGEAEVGHFIVMELVQGQTLRALPKPCPVDLIVNLGGQTAKALIATHSAGITHRDIKPDNIMLRDDGYVKILDFGLARLMPATATDTEAATLMRQTKPGALLGTVAYMSPEQARGEPVGPASDIFSLGIVLYELATGRHPFKADSPVGMLHAITAQTPLLVSRSNCEIPPSLDALILRMLEKDAVLRPVAAEVEAALHESQTLAKSARREDEAKLSPSIAVLPFVNMSSDPDNEYFCDGLAEELLNALSKIEALRVAARTSAFSFKGKETDIREIGQKLNVGAVLEGSVRKAGNRLRITAQLVNVADGYHLWSERYDREMQDIFDIQDEISLAIVAALKVKLLGVEKAAVLKRYTENTEAYQLYLKGRFHCGKWTAEGMKRAIEYFEQAIGIEPDYAPAFTGLAACYVYLWMFSYLPPDESLPKLKAAATRAVEIDSELAESHYSMARWRFWYEWDFDAAEREFKRAIELNPNYAEAHERYASMLSCMGRYAEAVAEGDRALDIDPLSFGANLNIGWVFWCAGLYDRALEQGRKLIELEANFYGGRLLIGVEAWRRGDHDQAIAALEKAVLVGGGPLALSLLGSLCGVAGKPDKARQALDRLQSLNAKQYVLRFYLALIHAGIGENDCAFELFEQAYEQRDGMLVMLKDLARLIPGFNADPRLADLLRRIRLPE